MAIRRSSAFAVLALALAVASGCIPPRIVWLPDSSGFIYSTAGPWNAPVEPVAKLFLYDLKRNAARFLNDLPSQSTMMPSFSPDGKQAAFVRIHPSDDGPTAQVIRMDIDTGQVHESKPASIGATKKDQEAIWAVAEWAPTGDRLLIIWFDPGEKSPTSLGSYDIKTETLTVLPGFLMTFLDRPLNGSIAGDGSGFLAFSTEKLEQIRSNAARDTFDGVSSTPFEALTFVDWSGRSHAFEMDAGTRAALAKSFDDCAEQFACASLLVDSTLHGSWAGPIAELPLPGGVVRIDCARFTLNFKNESRVAEQFARMKHERVEISRSLAAGDAVFEVIATDPPDKNAERTLFGRKRIDIWMPKTGERRTILEDVTKLSVSPAPDGRKLAIRYSNTSEADSGPERIIVFDNHGNSIAQFEIEKPVENVAVRPPQGEARAIEPPHGDVRVIDPPARAGSPRRAEPYAELLAADPSLREEFEAANRYIAACAALLISRDGSTPDEPERARLRGLALGWLNEDLALRRRQLQSGAATARTRVQQILAQWRVERDLARVRDPDALAKLPEVEQKAWRALWTEVDALEKRAQGDHP